MRIVIVGAGFGGVAAAIELRRHGFEDLRILERAPEVGGTWFYNSYPGSACHVPSHLYSFSYAQRRDWSRICSPREEIVRDSGAAAIDVRAEVEAQSDREVQTRFVGTAWTQCDSWYRDDSGRVVANWPGYMRDYQDRLRIFDQREFELVRLPQRAPVAA